MLLFSLLALIVLAIILTIHCTNHFQLHICEIQNNSPICTCGLSPKDTFKFFPKSFMIYVVLNILLCFISIIMCIVDNNKNNSIQLIFTYSMQSQKSINDLSQQTNTVIIFGYILIYGIMILSIWESLFAFYRYYTTYMTSTKLLSVSTKDVLKKFAIYGIIFCVLFILQIHVYYWIFPVLLTFNFVFNLYCKWKFLSILISKCKLFQQDDDFVVFLQKLYVFRTASSICYVVQSLSFGLFIIIYNINIIYILPLLWCVSSTAYTMNFVRNRTYLRKKCHQVCICSLQSKLPKMETTGSKSPVSAQINNLNTMPAASPKFIRSSMSDHHTLSVNKNTNNKPLNGPTDDELLNALPSTQTQMRLTQSENNITKTFKLNALDVPILFEDKSININMKPMNKTSSAPINDNESQQMIKKDVLSRVSQSDGRYGLEDDIDALNEFRNEIAATFQSLHSLRDYGFCTKADIESISKRIDEVEVENYAEL